MGALVPCTVVWGPVDQVGCPWSWQTLPWVMRELGAEQRGDFVTGPHPALDFSLGFVILSLHPALKRWALHWLALGQLSAPTLFLQALNPHSWVLTIRLARLGL